MIHHFIDKKGSINLYLLYFFHFTFLRNKMENSSIIQPSDEIMNIFAHRLDGDNTILYRVQWTNRKCEWVDGNNLFNEKYQKYLIKYWQLEQHEFTNIATQTNPTHAFDFSITKENIEKWTNVSFRSFRPPSQETRNTHCLIPYSIDSIDVIKQIALVRFFEDTGPIEMELDRLLMLAPRLVARFYMNMHNQ